MFVIPSVNLEPDASRSYATGIANAVQDLEQTGFTRVQLVLGPVDRRLSDFRVIEEVVREAQCPIQVLGRFETTEDIDDILSAGADLVVLGPRALDELEWMSSVAARFPDQLIVSSAARERRARTRGAMRTLPLDLRDVASEISAVPLAGLIVEFAPDAMIAHPDLALLEDVAEDIPYSLLVSGGTLDLGTLRDLEFRGVGATIINIANLSAAVDGQTLARSFGA